MEPCNPFEQLQLGEDGVIVTGHLLRHLLPFDQHASRLMEAATDEMRSGLSSVN